MGGVRIGGIATIDCVDQGFAVIAPGGGGATAAVWFGNHNQSFVELVNSRVFTGGMADATISPDLCTVVYTTIPNSGLLNYVTVCRTNDMSAFTDIASEPNGLSTGTNTTMFPRWNPLNTRIAYNGLELPDFGVDATIHVVSPDGSNNDTVYSAPTVVGPTPPAGNVPGRAFCPQWSDDGTKILFFQGGQQDGMTVNGTDRTIFTMDPDGSSVVQVAQTPFFFPFGGDQTFIPCFLPGTTQVVYMTTTGNHPISGDYQVRRVDADGTNDTLLYTDPVDVASHTNGFFGIPPGPFGPLADGSGLLYLQNDPGEPAFFDYIVGVVDSAGGGFTPLAPQRVSAAFGYQANYPVMQSDGRIWWDDGMFGAGGDGIVSVLPDGSDYTVEDNATFGVNDMTFFG